MFVAVRSVKSREERFLTPFARGFTLIEVLVVIAIIGILVAITLPAVQMARESARRSSCGNNLHQLAVAIKLHEETHGIYPTGGWGPDWVGDPDLGFCHRQPGGWIYNILPYIEQAPLREIGSGLPEEEKRTALTRLLESPVEIFNCPSRRSAKTHPYTGIASLQNVDPPTEVAKSDYVINNEISYEKSEVILSEIQLSRGVSKTVLVGEKSLARTDYTSGTGSGDRLSMYMGDCDDIAREVSGEPESDAQGGTGFGSAHPMGCNVAMGDGAVRFVSLDEPLQP